MSPGYAPFGGGGVEVVVENTSRVLAAQDDTVEVWTPLRHVAATRSEIAGGVTVRRFPATRSEAFPVSRRLLEYVHSRAGLFDIIHVHNYHSSVALAVLAARARTPVVFSPHYHGGGHTGAARALHIPYAVAGRRVFQQSATIIAVSQAELALLRRDFGRNIGRAVVIQNGTDAHDIVAAVPRPSVNPTVLVLGRLEQHKRVDLVIRAFDQQTAPGQLIIIGDGAQRQYLTALAASRRRGADIHLVGRLERPEVLGWMRTALGLISLSEREAFGLVALEAATAGASVILSDIPAHREVAELSPLIDVVSSSDSAALALHRVLTSQRSQPRVLRTWDHVAADFRALYASIL